MRNSCASTSSPSATIWSPGPTRTRSPTTTSPIAISRSRPSRTASARGATSSASRSNARLARTSWAIPIVVLATITPRNSASRQSPNASVTAPNTAKIRLNTVSTFARTMLL